MFLYFDVRMLLFIVLIFYFYKRPHLFRTRNYDFVYLSSLIQGIAIRTPVIFRLLYPAQGYQVKQTSVFNSPNHRCRYALMFWCGRQSTNMCVPQVCLCERVTGERDRDTLSCQILLTLSLLSKLQHYPTSRGEEPPEPPQMQGLISSFAADCRYSHSCTLDWWDYLVLNLPAFRDIIFHSLAVKGLMLSICLTATAQHCINFDNS